MAVKIYSMYKLCILTKKYIVTFSLDLVRLVPQQSPAQASRLMGILITMATVKFEHDICNVEFHLANLTSLIQNDTHYNPQRAGLLIHESSANIPF